MISLKFYRVENNGEDVDRKKGKENVNSIPYQEPAVPPPSGGGTIKVSFFNT